MLKNSIHCDKCGEIIPTPQSGFSIIGDIGVASFPGEFGGLIGGNGSHEKQVDYCTFCFLEILGLRDKVLYKKQSPTVPIPLGPIKRFYRDDTSKTFSYDQRGL